MGELHDLARDLVAVPSHEDEAAAGDRVEEWLRAETGADVTRDDAGNVLARRGDPGRPALALVGHHDVVPPADEQVADGEYVVETRDGRLYGRGSADMKGALAAMLHAFRDADPAGELAFASFVGEETGGRGARHAIDAGFDPEYAVVGEGSTGYESTATDVAVAHRGRRASTLAATGESAHASEPEAGENAVYLACDAVDVVRGLDAPAAEVLGHDLRGSVVVTEIAGGSAWNVVPDECTVTVDERTVPGARADLAAAAGPGVEWTVDQDLPPMACDDADFADAVLAAARAAPDAADDRPEHTVKPHATDAGWLAGADTTCVVAGPSERGEAHTATESVSLAALERCRHLYRAAAESWPPA